jgi:hypothetical protein
MIQLTDQINEIMDWFDFDKVHKVMEAINWTWHGVNGNTEVPSVPQIRKFARDLMSRMLDEQRGPNATHATGGFVTSLSDGYLSLQFVVSDWFVEEYE